MPWDGGAPAGLAPVATTGPADSPGPAPADPANTMAMTIAITTSTSIAIAIVTAISCSYRRVIEPLTGWSLTI